MNKEKILTYIFVPIGVIGTILFLIYPDSRVWLFPLLFLLVSIGSFYRSKGISDKILAYGCLVLFVGSIFYYWVF